MSAANTIARLGMVIGANTREFETALARSQRKFDTFGRQMAKRGKTLSAAITAPMAAVGYSAVRAFDAQAKAVAQVDQALQTTQGAVGRTSAELQRMASELQSNTLFGDEDILQNATAQLLTFTNITGENFDRTQRAALDLATRLDGDLKSASIQLGKALNDPATGLTALTRSGITFSEEQKAVIKSLQQSGRLAEAQAMILGELEKQYGGSAAAAVTGAGKLQQLGNTLGDITETFGKFILEALDPVIERLKSWAAAFQELSPSTQKLIAVIAGLAAALGPLMIAIGYLSTNVMPGLAKTFSALGGSMGGFKSKVIPAVIGALQKLWAVMLANPLLAIVAGVTALGAALYAVTKQFDGMSAAQRAVADVNKTAAQAVAGERAELEQLISVARNNNLSLETRQKAIKKLNEVSPEYLSNLSLENINTKEATTALNNYVKSLERRARVTAAQERLVEIERELIEAQQDLEDGPNFWEKVSAAVNPLPGNLDAATIAQASYNKTVSDLTSQKEALLGILTETQTGLDAITSSGSNAAASLKNVATAAQGVGQPINMSAAPVIGPSTIDGPTIGEPTLQTDGVGEFQGYTADSNLLLDTLDEIGITTEQVGESFATLGTRVGDAFANMGRDGQSAFQALANSVREAMGEIINALVAKAVSGVIANSFASLPPPVAAGVAAGFAGVAKGLFNSLVPAFAQGGLVTGPMLAMVGDNPSGKEAIIPFEKMGAFLNMAGGGNQNVQVAGQFRLQGNDLVAVIDRTSQRRQNTI